jgi:hypothetical protein
MSTSSIPSPFGRASAGSSLYLPSFTDKEIPSSEEAHRKALATSLADEISAFSISEEQRELQASSEKKEPPLADLSARINQLSLMIKDHHLVSLYEMSATHGPIHQDIAANLRDRVTVIKSDVDQFEDISRVLHLPEPDYVITCRKLSTILEKNLKAMSHALTQASSPGDENPCVYFPKGFASVVHLRVNYSAHNKTIGKGSFGVITQVHHEDTWDPYNNYVVKSPHTLKYLRSRFSNDHYEELSEDKKTAVDSNINWEQRMTSFESEINILFCLPQHPGIIEFLGVTEHGLPMFEYIAWINLDHSIKKHLLGDEEYYNIAQKLAMALSALHRIPLIHRDVKPANVMLTPNGDPKLIDFGLALSRFTEITLKTPAGTLHYSAPESLSPEPTYKDSRVDTWSYGCLVFFMLTEARVYLLLWEAYHSSDEPFPSDSILLWKFLKQCVATSEGVCLLNQTMEDILKKADEKISQLGLPPEHGPILSLVLRRCLKISIEERPFMTDIEALFSIPNPSL